MAMATNTTRRWTWPQIAFSAFLAAAGRAVLPTAAALFIGPTVGEMLLTPYGIHLLPATVGAFGAVATFLMLVYLQEAVGAPDWI